MKTTANPIDDKQLHVETDDERWVDVKVKGNGVVSVDVDDEVVSVKVIDPKAPEDAVEEFRFERPGEDDD